MHMPLLFLDSNTLSGVLTVTGGSFALIATIIQIWRKKIKKHMLTKITYVKVIHLTKQSKEHRPIYDAYIKRLKKYVHVYDEAHLFRLNVFHSPPQHFIATDRSSGIVDTIIIDPWMEKLHFTDTGAEKISNYLLQHVEVKTNIFFSKSMYYNGLQDGNEDFGMKMEFDTDMARMIVDLSSLPSYKDIVIGLPDAVIVTSKNEESLGVVELQPGIYTVCKNNLKKDDVIRMNFTFNWKIIEQNSLLKTK